jgi:hypothetical protein
MIVLGLIAVLGSVQILLVATPAHAHLDIISGIEMMEAKPVSRSSALTRPLDWRMVKCYPLTVALWFSQSLSVTDVTLAFPSIALHLSPNANFTLSARRMAS